MKGKYNLPAADQYTGGPWSYPSLLFRDWSILPFVQRYPSRISRPTPIVVLHDERTMAAKRKIMMFFITTTMHAPIGFAILKIRKPETYGHEKDRCAVFGAVSHVP